MRRILEQFEQSVLAKLLTGCTLGFYRAIGIDKQAVAFIQLDFTRLGGPKRKCSQDQRT